MNFSQKNRHVVGLLLLSSIFVAGCGNFSNSHSSTISDCGWRLEALKEGDSVVWRGVSDDSGAPTLFFSEAKQGKVNGWTGSNPFDGHYTLTDSAIQVHIEALGLNPAGDSLSIENRLVEFFQSPATIGTSHDTLTLSHRDGSQAKFSRTDDN